MPIQIYLLFPFQITTQALLLFSCKRMGLRAEDMYLNADLSQQCWTPKHIGWAVGLGVRICTSFETWTAILPNIC